MKKIRKLSEITLKDKDLAQLRGGGVGNCSSMTSCVYDTCGETFSIDIFTAPCKMFYINATDPAEDVDKPNPDPSSCKCGCAGCIVQDGGTGFALGMMYNHQ